MYKHNLSFPDQGTENSSDTQRTITQTIEQTSHMTQNGESQAVSVTSDSENEFTNIQGNVII